MIQKIKATIKGISPLLMHAYPFYEDPDISKKSPEIQAEYGVYRDPDTNKLFIPGNSIRRALINAATYSKGKNRSSLQKPVAACVLVFPERCDLGVSEYQIDARTVVIGATKGRIMRYRPRLDIWQASFVIEYDDSLLMESQLKKILDDTGSRVGILDFRPERKGEFGRFMVTEWKNI